MDPKDHDVTITDLEAGLENLKRGTPRHVDAMLVVIEPYWRSIETGLRVADLAHGLEIPAVGFAGNKAREQADIDLILKVTSGHKTPLLGIVPFDDDVTAADRAGKSAIDINEQARSVRAVSEIRQKLAALAAQGSAPSPN